MTHIHRPDPRPNPRAVTILSALLCTALLSTVLGCSGSHERPEAPAGGTTTTEPGRAEESTDSNARSGATEAAPSTDLPNASAPGDTEQDEAATERIDPTGTADSTRGDVASEPRSSSISSGSGVSGSGGSSSEVSKRTPSNEGTQGTSGEPESVDSPEAGGLPVGRPVLTTLSNDGGYWIVAAPSPPDVPLNETFSLDVWVFDGNERSNPTDPETGLTLDADMPAHRHGMVRRPRVIPVEPGKFRVEGMRLHMPGRWQIYFDVRRRGITERGQIDLDLEG